MTSLPTRLIVGVQVAGRRLRPYFWPAVQASVAAAVAWYLAHDVLGHPAPIFAPVAAAANGKPQALAWNSGTMSMMLSRADTAITSAAIATKVWSICERWL